MSNAITRSPSLSLIHDSLADYHQRPADAPRACEDRLERHLRAGSQQEVLARGSRLLDLVREAPRAASAASEAPVFPGGLPDMPAYLAAATPLVEQLARALDAKSPLFRLARAILQEEEMGRLEASQVLNLLAPVDEELQAAGVDLGLLQADMGGAVIQTFLAEEAALAYATHLSSETLEFLASDAATGCRQAFDRMLEAFREADMARGKPAPSRPLTPHQEAQVQSLERRLPQVVPGLLAQLNTPEDPKDPAKCAAQRSAKQAFLLEMVEALSPLTPDELVAYLESAPIQEVKAKASEIVLNQRNTLLTTLANAVCAYHVESAQLEKLIQSAQIPLPEDPQEQAAVVEALRQQLRAAAAQAAAREGDADAK